MRNNKDKEYWETKTWYRFSKVVYYSLYLITLLIFGLLVYSSYRPTSNTFSDDTKTLIKCNNGKSYNALDNSLYLSENNRDLSIKAYDYQIKALCKFGASDFVTVADLQKKGELPKEKNYSVEFFQTTNNYGSWEEVFTKLIIGVLIILTVFEIIKRVFLYITIGRNPFKINK